MLSTLAHIKATDFTLVARLFQLELEFPLTTAEVSYHIVYVLWLLKLADDHIKRVFVPFLNLVAVTFMVLS